MNSRTSPQPWTWLARIRRPQGRKGEVFAELLTDFPEKFSERRQLWLLTDAAPEAVRRAMPHTAGLVSPSQAPHQSPQPVELTGHWLHKGGIVLHFAGIDSISAAEGISGCIVAIPRAERAALAEDEIYVSDLIGCALIDVAGAASVLVGEIEDIDRSAGPVALLVVSGRKGEVLIPFAKSYLRKIDLESRCVEMALPEGLVGLNENADSDS